MTPQKQVTLRRVWDVEVDLLDGVEIDARIGLCPFLSAARGRLTNCARDRCHLWLRLSTEAGECSFLATARWKTTRLEAVQEERSLDTKRETKPASRDATDLEHGSAERLVLSVAEAARTLGVSRNTAYQSVQEGGLPSVRFGRRILIPRKALLERIERLGEQAQ